MKVLYLASNPDPDSKLLIEREITSLQRLAGNSGNKNVTFTFLPDLPFEEVGQFIQSEQPDVVHISAHGGKKELLFANSVGDPIDLSAEALSVLLAYAPPKLVYLNSCTSHAIAKTLGRDGLIAIGTDKPITNFAALQGASAFYTRLLHGSTIAEAFKASASVVEVLSKKGVKTILYPERAHAAANTRLHRPARIVATIYKDKFTPSNGLFDFEIGLSGCSAQTKLVVFATDDEEFEKTDPTNDLCEVVRTSPVASEIWLDDPWTGIYGDFRIHALACNGDGTSYCVSSTIVEALIEFYKVRFSCDTPEKFPPTLQTALRRLKHEDGAKMRPARPNHE